MPARESNLIARQGNAGVGNERQAVPWDQDRGVTGDSPQATTGKSNDHVLTWLSDVSFHFFPIR